MALASLAASGALTSAVSGVGTTALTTVCVGSLRLIATSSQDKRSAATVSTSEARPGLPDLGLHEPHSHDEHHDRTAVELLKVRYGVAKKVALKLVNKKLVLRFLARRLSIAIPVYGCYSAARLLRSDLRRTLKEREDGLDEASRAFALCAMLDAADVACQSVVITSLVWSLFGIGLPVAAPLVAVCDKAALGACLVSTVTGLYGEYVSDHRLFASDEVNRRVAEIAQGK